MRSTSRVLVRLAPLFLVTMLGALAPSPVDSQDARPEKAPAPPSATTPAYPRSPDDVMAALNRAMAWYRQARIVMRSVEGTGIFGHGDEQTAVRLIGRAFDAAHAQAALLGRADAASPSGRSKQRAEERAQLEATVRQEEQEVARLGARLRGATGKARAELERLSVAATNRLELDRARLDFFAQLTDVGATRSGPEDDLEHQIAALQEAVPELRPSSAAPAAAAPAVAAAPSGSTSGTWANIQRLLALQRSRGQLEDLELATTDLAQRVNAELTAARAAIRPITTRLGTLAKDPTDSGASLQDSQREFRDLLEQRKLLAAVVLPLRDESALARRYAADLKGWDEVMDRASKQALQGLGIDLLGVVVALAVIFIGGVLWRTAVVRYVTDGARRRLLLTARSIFISLAVALVLIFHFTSEMAALVTALGFAAAGIAFALQNVILAVAGYFTMVAPNGIRIGDRVSLQGPFGYVHGEVVEIGFVRIKLHELGGEPLRPTGRVVVFPNSVVFTGSFFKDPPTEP
jgi:hypothetical protein